MSMLIHHFSLFGMWAVVLFVLITGGCGKSPVIRDKEPIDFPQTYADVPVEGHLVKNIAVALESQELGELLDRAFEANLDMKMAWTRIARAEAAEREARAALFPLFPLRIGASRSRAPLLPFGDELQDGLGGSADNPDGRDFTFGDGTRTAVTRNQFDVSLGASYEIDLRGRLRHRLEAAALDAVAARRDAESLAVTIAAEVTEIWVTLAAEHERQALLKEQIQVSSELLELIELRFERGMIPASEVMMQEQELSTLNGLLIINEAEMIRAANQLAILLGQAPRSEMTIRQKTLPSPLPVTAAGVPSDLLDRRPDVRASRLRLEGADASLAAAVAQRLPSLRLTASLFDQSQQIGELFSRIFWSIGASAEYDIFDGGRAGAMIEQAEAVAEEQFFSYGLTLLQAIREVQDALSLGMHQEDYISHLQQQINAASTVLEFSRTRYLAGEGDYLTLLMNLQRLQSLQVDLLEARRRLFSLRLQLWRALGGGWSAEDET